MQRWTISNLSSIDLLDAKTLARKEIIFDLMIAACAYENRCMKFPRLLSINANKKIALVTPGFVDLDQREQKLSRFGFQVINLEQNKIEDTIKEIAQSCQLSSDSPVRVLLDISSLTRKMIAFVVSGLTKALGTEGFELTYVYTLAAYDPAPASQTPPNRKVAPVHPLFAGWTKPEFPVSAIVGLGYERGKALGAVEYLQASSCFLFLPSSPENKYRAKVDKHNSSLLKAVSGSNIIDYDVLRPLHTLHTLNSVVRGMLATEKPILLPFGPKIFFAVSLLLSLSYPEVAVWHVDGEETAPMVDYCATSHMCAIRCTIQLCHDLE